MDTNKKIALLEEMLELDEGTLEPDTLLDDIDEWDSMSKLSLIVLLDEEFNTTINSEQVKALNCVQDILDLMTDN